ncbi:hypothetical protein CDD83_6488 [Cordyceps sp. RAO-2017]|nr:hypothetical protein CDD83_6488 [Cordyceps sp. RAO-2017]
MEWLAVVQIERQPQSATKFSFNRELRKEPKPENVTFGEQFGDRWIQGLTAYWVKGGRMIVHVLIEIQDTRKKEDIKSQYVPCSTLRRCVPPLLTWVRQRADTAISYLGMSAKLDAKAQKSLQELAKQAKIQIRTHTVGSLGTSSEKPLPNSEEKEKDDKEPSNGPATETDVGGVAIREAEHAMKEVASFRERACFHDFIFKPRPINELTRSLQVQTAVAGNDISKESISLLTKCNEFLAKWRPVLSELEKANKQLSPLQNANYKIEYRVTALYTYTGSRWTMYPDGHIMLRWGPQREKILYRGEDGNNGFEAYESKHTDIVSGTTMVKLKPGDRISLDAKLQDYYWTNYPLSQSSLAMPQRSDGESPIGVTITSSMEEIVCSNGVIMRGTYPGYGFAAEEDRWKAYTKLSGKEISSAIVEKGQYPGMVEYHLRVSR